MMQPTILQRPPSSAMIPEDLLPGIFAFVRSERIVPMTMESHDRIIEIDVVLQASGSTDAAIDDVDAMQLAVEVAVAEHFDLNGLCRDLQPTSSDIYTQQGEAVFAARRLTLTASIQTPLADPGVLDP